MCRYALHHYGIAATVLESADIVCRYDDMPNGWLGLGEFLRLVQDLEHGLIRSSHVGREIGAERRARRQLTAAYEQERLGAWSLRRHQQYQQWRHEERDAVDELRQEASDGQPHHRELYNPTQNETPQAASVPYAFSPVAVGAADGGDAFWSSLNAASALAASRYTACAQY